MDKFYSLDATVRIPEGADLNDYTTPGNYLCEAAGVAATLQNSPVTAAGFVLHVERVTGGLTTNFAKQRVVANSGTSEEYWRNLRGGAWKDWVSIATSQQSIIITSYFTIKPSEGATLQMFGKSASINFSGTFSVNIPTNANTTIATLPEQYRPKYTAQGIIKVWPSKDSSGNITVSADTGFLILEASGALKVVNRFGQAYAAGRYVSGFLNYIIA